MTPASAMTLSGPTLAARMKRALGLLLGSSVVSQALRLGSSLLLTRLLAPEAFGLVATVQTVYLALVMFSDLGVWQSVVNHRHGREPGFLATAFSVQLARGVLLALVVLSLALALHLARGHGLVTPGTVYADPRLAPMLAAMALCALIQGAESMKLALAQRDLQAGALTRLELLAQLSGTATTLALAWATRSVWALVAGTLVAALARSVFSHVLLSGPAVRPGWQRAHARDLVGFGQWIFLSSVIGFAAAHGEKLLLGGALGASTFGVYAIAATLMSALTGLVGSLNAHLIFPGLSEALRQGSEAGQQMWLRVQRLADLVLGLLAGLLATAGGWLVTLLYDPRYAAAGWMLQLLGLGLLALRVQVLEQLMFARGQPAWVTASNALRALSLAMGIPLGLALDGERGALLAVLASQFAGWPLALAFRWRSGLRDWRTETTWPLALGAGLLAGSALHAALRLLWPH